MCACRFLTPHMEQWCLQLNYKTQCEPNGGDKVHQWWQTDVYENLWGNAAACLLHPQMHVWEHMSSSSGSTVWKVVSSTCLIDGIIVVYFSDGSHNCSNVKAAGTQLLPILLSLAVISCLWHKWLLSATAGGYVESGSSLEGCCQSAGRL